MQASLSFLPRPVCVFAVILAVASVAAAEDATPRPNFLIVIADDLCWRDLGFTGNPDVQTPNIDRLAKEGMWLRGMFTPASTCSPLRHALYTGLYPIRSGAYPNHTTVDQGTRSIFTHLKAAGYRVGLLGKTHINPASSFPFEKLGNNPDDADAIKSFVARDKRQPWMAVVASHDPHGPWTRGPKELYDPAKLKIPPYLHDNAETRRGLAAYYAEITALDGQVGACMKVLDETGQAENTLVLFVSEQGGSMPYAGKWTLYDNGIRTASIIRWPGKVKPGSVADALIQYIDVPPTFLEAAGVDPKSIDTGCSDANDNRGFDGRSFLGVLLGKQEKSRQYVFAQHTTVGVNGFKQPYPSRAVRDARYKLIRNFAPDNEFWIGGIQGDPIFRSWQEDAQNDPALATRVRLLSHRPAEELYDLESDPYEMKNLADNRGLAPVKARLSSELDGWMKQQGDHGMETELKAPSRQPGRSEGAKAKAKPAAKAKRKKPAE